MVDLLEQLGYFIFLNLRGGSHLLDLFVALRQILSELLELGRLEEEEIFVLRLLTLKELLAHLSISTARTEKAARDQPQ